ncbi:hypothetical protein CLV46_2118 [Diaminobutyricimonas aerilata]|uniref:Lipoprotein n=1 Tax=Diaminobutyricimonas aerilata TaxID=1162967 RepID=A0A2M9CKW9_9MICO|nr:hypothetical protein [Diaminobutyricimonas aerilata]PJJ72546.1 hypothetical protein CLV46_2118 [Diaminobutyricimonas aerilata]
MRRRTGAAVLALLCLPLLVSGCIASGLPESTREERISYLQRSLDEYWASATAQDPPMDDLVGRGIVVVPDDELVDTVVECLRGLGFDATAHADGSYSWNEEPATTVPSENLGALCFARIVSEEQLQWVPGPRELAATWAHQTYITLPCLERAGHRVPQPPPLAAVLSGAAVGWDPLSEIAPPVRGDAALLGRLISRCPPYPEPEAQREEP